MSSHINNLIRLEKDAHNGLSQDGENPKENNLRQYLCVIENCGWSFKDPLELKEHLNSHLEN